MSNKLISIVGPTGVGKTGFALELVKHLEKKFPGQFAGFDIISADSRQVYRDLEIISGADVPAAFSLRFGTTDLDQYFESGRVRLFGLLMLPYSAEWSVAHFKEFAKKVVAASWQAGRLPMIVGGTGLYHEHLFNPSPILDIKPNLPLRQELADKSVSDLQARLKQLSPAKFEAMNESDRHNPTRLVRAIEIAAWEQSPVRDVQPAPDSINVATPFNPDFDHLVMGLTDDLATIEARIQARVEARWTAGAGGEVEKLMNLAEEFGPNRQLLSATGVKEIQAYLGGVAEKAEAMAKWSRREFQYAKRQITWWKKKATAQWFKVATPDWQKQAFSLVEKFISPSDG